MAIKLDMAKAYDRVKWNFLCLVLTKMGFSRTFVSWIFAYINSASFSFMVKGEACGWVLPNRGIRQGDPLSPYLFLIISEAFSNLISQAKVAGRLTGIRISRAAPVVTHLFSADDALLFNEASEEQALNFKMVLDQYCLASGQKVNFEKSSVFFSSNTPDQVRSDVCSIMGNIQEQKKIKHLGLPLSIGRSKKEIFKFVVDMADRRVSNWKANFLSMAGKEVLVKFVLNALPNYIIACYKLLVVVCDDLDRTISKFWWGSKEGG
ncbi:hypothetical protein DH2020_027414 [Rehmannia glutinosa]|uniref:Reverse transcriptase domain-containing protein n=1 Tax=Rehmannia glutinosa TaxID=99300 RepID=A0ABR0VX23_REHGL